MRDLGYEHLCYDWTGMWIWKNGFVLIWVDLQVKIVLFGLKKIW